MSRKVLLYSAVVAFFAPSLLAQGVTVCVFQGKESHDMATQYATDPQNVAAELSGKTLPNGGTIQAIAVPGINPKEEDAAAQSHHCGYIASVWREEILAAPAGFSGMNGSGDPSSAIGAHSNQAAMDQGNDTRVDYLLRRTGSHKKLAGGEANSGSPWDHIADEMVKKLAKEEK